MPDTKRPRYHKNGSKKPDCGRYKSSSYTCLSTSLPQDGHKRVRGYGLEILT
jgi:hypothetical protein